jgi:hypothetical protein
MKRSSLIKLVLAMAIVMPAAVARADGLAPRVGKGERVLAAIRGKPLVSRRGIRFPAKNDYGDQSEHSVIRSGLHAAPGTFWAVKRAALLRGLEARPTASGSGGTGYTLLEYKRRGE